MHVLSIIASKVLNSKHNFHTHFQTTLHYTAPTFYFLFIYLLEDFLLIHYVTINYDIAAI